MRRYISILYKVVDHVMEEEKTYAWNKFLQCFDYPKDDEELLKCEAFKKMGTHALNPYRPTPCHKCPSITLQIWDEFVDLKTAVKF